MSRGGRIARPHYYVTWWLALAVLGATPAAALSPSEVAPELRELLSRMIGVYREARTYRDDGRLTILEQSGRIRNITKMPSSIQFVRPNRLQVISGTQTIGCDGKQLQIVLDAYRQYQRRAAPPRLGMDHIRLGAPGAGLDEGFPEILEFLLGEDVLNRWLAPLVQIELRQPAEPVRIQGEECHVVVCQTRHRARATLFIGRQRTLLLRCDLDYTEARRPAGFGGEPEGPVPPTLQYAYQLEPVVLNDPIADAAFGLHEPPGMKLVSEFTPPSPLAASEEPPGPALDPTRAGGGASGLPTRLPEFRTADLSGQPVDRAALAGKVALLFFWTPRGSGESLSSIPMVQELANAFADQMDFCPLGITLGTEDPAFVKGLLAAKRASFRTVLDTDGTLTSALRVSVVPTFCLVSRGGTVPEVVAGMPEGGAETLKRKIEQLLSR